MDLYISINEPIINIKYYKIQVIFQSKLLYYIFTIVILFNKFFTNLFSFFCLK
jgi:hypothetical protein